MQQPQRTAIIIDEREEFIVSLAAGDSRYLRAARFLRPSISSTDTDLPKLPPSAVSSLHRPWQPPRASALNITFQSWRSRPGNWATWVEKMASSHQLTWKNSGIYDAVLNSTCPIKRNNELIIGLVEKWCCDTKSFIFPWGEASVTLEDVMVLGGFSVVGSPVFKPLESERLKKIESSLKDARIEMVRTKAKKASPSMWMEKFMDSGSEFEHEAFLACWLSRYVFVNARETIRDHVLPMAIHLARGIRIALAPAVLASIYKDLCSLKDSIVSSANYGKEEVIAVTLWSPFQLFQVWAWERFPQLKPEPNVLNSAEPRLFRWRDVSRKIENVRLALDSAKDSFEWRPYTKPIENWKFPKFYAEKETYVSLSSRLDKEVESFARCLRTSELVGLDCIEQYLPIRVAMQFGMDQDIPGSVVRSTESPEIAWNDYIDPLGDGELWIPPQSFRGGVTVRYSVWWEQSVMGLKNADYQKKGKRSLKKRPGPLTEKKLEAYKMSSCSGSHRKKERTSPGTDDASATPNVNRRSSRRRRADDKIASDSNSPVLKSKSMVQLLEEDDELGNDGSTLPASDDERTSKRSRKNSGTKNKEMKKETSDVPLDSFKEDSDSHSFKRKKEEDAKNNGEAASCGPSSRSSKKSVQTSKQKKEIKAPAMDLDHGEVAGVGVEENNPTIAEMMISANKHNGIRHGDGDEAGHNSPSFSSTVADDEATNRLEPLAVLAERVVHDDEAGGSGKIVEEDHPESVPAEAVQVVNNKGKEVLVAPTQQGNGEGIASGSDVGRSKLTLEDRVSRLERLVKELHALKRTAARPGG